MDVHDSFESFYRAALTGACKCALFEIAVNVDRPRLWPSVFGRARARERFQRFLSVNAAGKP
jgi:hypothetical protein